MNLLELTPEQLKLAASIKEQIDGLNKQLRGMLGAPVSELRRQSDHERFCEMEDCRYAEGKMGQA